MKCDVIICGVGGQGVLSIAGVIAASALAHGLRVKQSEDHGMAQRGGEVVTHLRLSERPIHSDLVPRGTCDLIVSLEPVECLRNLPYLGSDGVVLTAVEPVTNLPSCPDLSEVLGSLDRLPRTHRIEASRLAREAGSPLAGNMVLAGAASHFLPIDFDVMARHAEEAFADKGPQTVQVNLKAMRSGREALACRSA